MLNTFCVAFCIFGNGAGTKAGVGSSRSGSVPSVYLEISNAVSGSLGISKSDCFLLLPDPEPEPLLVLEVSSFGAPLEVPGEREVFCDILLRATFFLPLFEVFQGVNVLLEHSHHLLCVLYGWKPLPLLLLVPFPSVRVSFAVRVTVTLAVQTLGGLRWLSARSCLWLLLCDG